MAAYTRWTGQPQKGDEREEYAPSGAPESRGEVQARRQREAEWTREPRPNQGNAPDSDRTLGAGLALLGVDGGAPLQA